MGFYSGIISGLFSASIPSITLSYESITYSIKFFSPLRVFISFISYFSLKSEKVKYSSLFYKEGQKFSGQLKESNLRISFSIYLNWMFCLLNVLTLT